MGVKGWPPSHRDPDEVQPESCYVCGLYLGAERMKPSHIEGIEGLMVCDQHEWRDKPTHLIHRQPIPDPMHGIGQSRVYPAGASLWWSEIDD